jgi:mono/diheme cytochrome c family protein
MRIRGIEEDAPSDPVCARSCVSCHGADGAGMSAPNIQGIRARRDVISLITWIKKPLPPMPALFPVPLSEQDVRGIAAYVETL